MAGKAENRKTDYLMLCAFIVLSELAGVIGAIFTYDSVSGWYSTLQKPFFTPPGWVFAPVWTILYLMMGAAAYLVWERRGKEAGANDALLLFFAQLALNLAWSIGFFGLRSPALGFAIIALLWLAIVSTLMAFARISKTAGDLLVPYLAWVSFASLLNASIWLMNP